MWFGLCHLLRRLGLHNRTVAFLSLLCYFAAHLPENGWNSLGIVYCRSLHENIYYSVDCRAGKIYMPDPTRQIIPYPALVVPLDRILLENLEK